MVTGSAAAFLSSRFMPRRVSDSSSRRGMSLKTGGARPNPYMLGITAVIWAEVSSVVVSSLVLAVFMSISLGGRGVLTVEVGPRAGPVGGGVGDALDEPAGEGRVGLQQGEPVLLLDQEEPGPPAGQGRVDQAPGLGLQPGQAALPLPQQAEGLAGRQRADERQRGHEGRVLVLRPLDQLGEPVPQLAAAGVGEGVHGALGPLPGAAGLLLVDEPGPGQLPDDHVQRSVVELDAAVVAVLAQGASQLVRVHGPL